MSRLPLTAAALALTTLLAACGLDGAPAANLSGNQAAEASAPDLAALPLDPYTRASGLQAQANERYNITLSFAPGSDRSVVKAVQDGAKHWQKVVKRGLPDLRANIPAGACGSNAAYRGTIDDLLVFTGNTNIDGPGGILAQSGPCSVRSSGGLTTYALLVFDTADLAQFSSQLPDIALHELGHALGIGSLWRQFGLVGGAGTPNPVYTGANGVREYRALGGPLATVPIENQGGPGTAGSHWRETTFAAELMTGYLNSGVTNPLSRVSAGSLQDMGYVVNYAAADAYRLPGMAAQAVGPGLDLGGREQIVTPRYRSE